MLVSQNVFGIMRMEALPQTYVLQNQLLPVRKRQNVADHGGVSAIVFLRFPSTTSRNFVAVAEHALPLPRRLASDAAMVWIMGVSVLVIELPRSERAFICAHIRTYVLL